MSVDGDRTDRWRAYWNRSALAYDEQMNRFERLMAPGSRRWVCSRAEGEVLEVAIGTGLNLPVYGRDVRLTGIEWSPRMLDLARQRAQDLDVPVDLREGDARDLPFPDAAFDSVVCTFGLCAIPDEQQAIAEMARVLRPGGKLLLLDHVAGSAWPVRLVQRVAELVTIPLGGEHFLRRPLPLVRAAGLEVEESDRFKLGIIERLAARKTVPALRDSR
ncbi:phosphatidylethanolamine N-methyltransferase [Saccharopolyspora kobensis]|uniref:Phosphatidylethanolamine N-methyltransferase n=1 Tax=Saccharopolyspora kobensis TaxID=146035 RepID=A0A1H5TB19_9PSEU|nr:class I SAM-dependent methyltransferase [Saccharopolyspora kobensis]SEF60025.1 phosphatidylethanolamine N-methyltransferase [Saccharopolyspora kobensis]SFC48094.1 phosphatidylethanolamine N-methyltransferase /phosphatidyl-N-methylethanolamine N-methyltransferase [Saccharopolyspora kobensis]